MSKEVYYKFRNALVFTAVLILCVFIISCTRTAGLPKLTDGVILTRTDVTIKLSTQISLPPTLSTQNYLEVDQSALPVLIDSYRQELFNQGIAISDITGQSGWDTRFNCTDFTDYFLGYAGAKVMVQLSNSWSVGQKPAIFALWYLPDGAKIGHSIVVVITNKGIIFIDPQLQNPVTLTLTERASVYHLRS
jgi:hypothetical protein